MQPAKPSKLVFGYEDYAAVPSDGKRWELIDGDFEVNPAPSPRHQTVSRRLQFELMRQLEEAGLAVIFDAPIDLILSDNQVLQPDLVILRESRQQLITERGIEGPPDIVVEVLSPGTRVYDQRVKKGVYSRFGVPEYWTVDPVGGDLELWRLAEGKFELERRFDRTSRLATPSFSEVAIDLARVFRP